MLVVLPWRSSKVLLVALPLLITIETHLFGLMVNPSSLHMLSRSVRTPWCSVRLSEHRVRSSANALAL